jgi:hypothetical protein
MPQDDFRNGTVVLRAGPHSSGCRYRVSTMRQLPSGSLQAVP